MSRRDSVRVDRGVLVEMSVPVVQIDVDRGFYFLLLRNRVGKERPDNDEVLVSIVVEVARCHVVGIGSEQRVFFSVTVIRSRVTDHCCVGLGDFDTPEPEVGNLVVIC